MPEVMGAGPSRFPEIEAIRQDYSEVLEPDADNPDRWINAEQYYFRDGWWVTAWQASVGRSIDEDTMPLYETLWP